MFNVRETSSYFFAPKNCAVNTVVLVRRPSKKVINVVHVTTPIDTAANGIVPNRPIKNRSTKPISNVVTYVKIAGIDIRKIFFVLATCSTKTLCFSTPPVKFTSN